MTWAGVARAMGTVLIAGGATGIGPAALRLFRPRGDDVLPADIAAGRGGAACAEEAAGRALFHHCDLADPAAPAAAVQACLDAFGGIDALVVDAAVLHQAPLEERTPEAWARSLAVNLSAPFLLFQAAALRRSPNASAILTSSTGALRGLARLPAYHATKTGLLGLVRSLADELSPNGVRLGALLPGFIAFPASPGRGLHDRHPGRGGRRLLGGPSEMGRGSRMDGHAVEEVAAEDVVVHARGEPGLGPVADRRDPERAPAGGVRGGKPGDVERSLPPDAPRRLARRPGRGAMGIGPVGLPALHPLPSRAALGAEAVEPRGHLAHRRARPGARPAHRTRGRHGARALGLGHRPATPRHSRGLNLGTSSARPGQAPDG